MTRVAIYNEKNPVAFEAARIDQQRWNGWACPAFTLDVVTQIGAWTSQLKSTFDDADVVTVEDGRVFVSDTDGKNEIPPDADGLYPVGAYGWVWEEVPDTYGQ